MLIGFEIKIKMILKSGAIEIVFKSWGRLESTDNQHSRSGPI